MKLALRFSLILFVGMLPVLAVRAYLTHDSEIELVDKDMEKDHAETGSTLAAIVGRVARTDGEDAAVRSVSNLTWPRSHSKTRWVWLDDPGVVGAIPPPQLEAALRGRVVSLFDRDPHRQDVLRTLAPVVLGSGRKGAIELSEPLTDEEERTAILRRYVIETTLLFGLVYAAIATLLGFWLVGAPVQRILAKIGRVGAGDFKGKLGFQRMDELGDVARGIDQMCDGLEKVTARLIEEKQSKVDAQSQLRHAERLTTTGRVLSGLAHELGTPLNIILVRARMISSGEASGDEARVNAGIVAEQAEEVSRMLRRHLDYARPREPAKTLVDLRDMLREATRALGPIASRGRVEVDLVGLDAEAPAHLDPTQIRQVITNLVMNGIEAMPSGGRLAVALGSERVERSPEGARPPGEYYRIRVEDEGGGIEDEALGHLFEPFFTTKGSKRGTGLGLWVAREIVSENGGWIEVGSRGEKGAVFSVFLPVPGRVDHVEPHPGRR